jgi:hypothetical protein
VGDTAPHPGLRHVDAGPLPEARKQGPHVFYGLLAATRRVAPQGPKAYQTLRDGVESREWTVSPTLYSPTLYSGTRRFRTRFADAASSSRAYTRVCLSFMESSR